MHASVKVARNIEFADYKEYSPGDPIRDLDWRVAARTDRLVVRRQQAERELSVTFVLDASGDLGTGTSGMYNRPSLEGSKFGTAITLIATMAWYLQRRGEPVGLVVLAGDQVPFSWLPPRRSPAHLVRMFSTLASIVPAGRADLATEFSKLGQRFARRSAVVLVSDLMEDPALWGPQLATLQERRVDVRVAHLYDGKEWALDFKKPVRFFSPEGGSALPIDPVSVQKVYQGVVEDYLVEVRGWLGSRRAQHVLVDTNKPIDRPLTQLLQGSGG